LLLYRDLNDLVQICIKVEQQLMRKSYTRKEKVQSKEDTWKVDNSIDKPRIEPPKAQCPSMRTILLKGKGINNNKDETAITRESGEYQSQNCEDTYPYYGELLLMINSN